VRVRVLTVAAAQLAAFGFDAMTMEGLVDASGIAKRTLYRWWPTKATVIRDALLSGFLDVPQNNIPRTSDIWSDLETWLGRAATSMTGAYGEVLRTSVAISATDPSLAATLNEQYTAPARSDIIDRLAAAVIDGQVTSDASLEDVADLLLAVIAYAGLTRADPHQLPSVLRTLRVGIAARRVLDLPASQGRASRPG
jgi:AcrR family transcriptional regulator